jgi:hypothetical protein
LPTVATTRTNTLYFLFFVGVIRKN